MASPITASGWARLILSSFLFGILLASFIPLTILLPLLLGVLFLLSIWRWFGRTLFLFVLLLAFMSGLFRYQFAIPDRGSSSIASVIGRESIIEGVISDEVKNSRSSQQVVLDQLLVDGEGKTGRLLLHVALYPENTYKERLRFTCTPLAPEPFEGFAYDRYLARVGILAECFSYTEVASLGVEPLQIRGRLIAIKTSIEAHLRLVVPEPFEALLEGLLFGEKRLPDTIDEAFRRAGLSHIVAASGQNVSLVVTFLLAILTGTCFSRKTASYVLLVGIWIYVALAGADAPVIRAGMMGSVLVLARLLERVASPINLLLLTATLMLLQNPLLLRDDIGFQLSFSATAGLLVLEPKVRSLLGWMPKRFGLRDALSTSLAAILATLPFSIFNFGMISLIAPFANVLVLPLIPIVMMMGAMVALCSFFSISFTAVLSAPLVGGLSLILTITHFVAEVPFASVNLSQIPPVKMTLVIFSLWLLRSVFRRSSESGESLSHFSWRTVIVSVILLSFVAGWQAFPRQGLTITFFDVGQGDATLLQFPDGERWLIDGGPDDTVLQKVGQFLPWYDRRLDVLIPTHADADHVTGLIETSRRYEIERVYRSDQSQTLRTDLLSEAWKETPIGEVRAGDVLRCDEVCVTVLAPTEEQARADDRNTRSVVLLVTYQGRSILLTGDASTEVEKTFLDHLPELDVLKAGHHGSYTSTSYELIQGTRPAITIISSGEENRYGHPHGIVLRRLMEAGSMIYRTDRDGDVRVRITKEGEIDVKTKSLLW